MAISLLPAGITRPTVAAAAAAGLTRMVRSLTPNENVTGCLMKSNKADENERFDYRQYLSDIVFQSKKGFDLGSTYSSECG
ncbi:hypothetical protein M0802_010695 [Mischocyttarus mexicanus]|nr:hypothetical protein M0802_010695 [Mischocyttarus mexicanus]